MSNYTLVTCKCGIEFMTADSMQLCPACLNKKNPHLVKQRKCKNCGKLFIPIADIISDMRGTCKLECFQAFYFQKRSCLKCGASFTVKKTSLQRYCTSKCRPRPSLNKEKCLTCGILFSTQKNGKVTRAYCIKCRKVMELERIPRSTRMSTGLRSDEKRCTICGIPIRMDNKGNRKYCFACATKRKIKQQECYRINDIFQHVKHDLHGHVHYCITGIMIDEVHVLRRKQVRRAFWVSMCMAETKTIWKYPLMISDEQEVETIKGGEILCVLKQHEHPMIYIKVNHDLKEKEKFKILVCGTGHLRNDLENAKYIGTLLFYEDTVPFLR